ncbi:TetR family transcriptional regulator [Mumia flava]|uniref:TetR family transcriptional regulator n=1 Tax=Mumia flava TaxID=1348852 RepID=A0A2M9BIF7_9ACTN|nr:TetR family transcriptional regulator C-terminal domain-containing protein [Mumia flava]PJJ57729.1 TetR family transcriptional regulator [Mumia flava]
MAPKDDRRTRIADAVIQTLAERGSRGLTHRAIDEHLDLPAGSTSYYARSRADLLACAVPRLAALDARALARHQESGPLDAIRAVLRASRRGDGRARTLARYELVLESVRRPDLQAALAEGTDQLLELLDGALRRGAPDAPADDLRDRARDLLAFLDGLLLADATGPARHRRSEAQLLAAVERHLATS